MPSNEAAKRLRTVAGYERVTHEMLQRWQRSGPKRKTGPKVCAAFEQEVLDKLVYRAVEDVANPESATIVANVTYSYAAIMLAASQVADESKWIRTSFALSCTLLRAGAR